jgi:hypothetical protein
VRVYDESPRCPRYECVFSYASWEHVFHVCCRYINWLEEMHNHIYLCSSILTRCACLWWKSAMSRYGCVFAYALWEHVFHICCRYRNWPKGMHHHIYMCSSVRIRCACIRWKSALPALWLRCLIRFVGTFSHNCCMYINWIEAKHQNIYTYGSIRKCLLMMRVLPHPRTGAKSGVLCENAENRVAPGIIWFAMSLPCHA